MANSQQRQEQQQQPSDLSSQTQAGANRDILPIFTPSPYWPSDSDEDADTSGLKFGTVWAYPCKLETCPEYGKTWLRAE